LLINEGKYVQQDNNWWIPSGRQAFDPNRFYLSHQMKDPFGEIYQMEYDRYVLSVVKTIDPLQNTVQVENDYRVMQPKEIIDPNGNRSLAAFDALGMVAGTAVMGKVTEMLGDGLEGFQPDLTQADIDAFLANPLGVAASLLGNATTRIIYDLEQFITDQQPVVAATIAREVHVNDLPAGTQSKVQVSLSYSDGFGREVQKKIQAEPGVAPQREVNATPSNRPGKLVLENGETKLVQTDLRWVGNGRTIFNNKGKPVKQYEPFFSGTHLYEDELELVMTGVTPIMFYDPAGRMVATLHPNHSYEKVVFDPWQQVTWDVNDTVANLPQDDAEVGQYFRRLPEADYFPTWLQRFSGSTIAPERDAAQKALAHAGTPAIAHLDTLGRPFLTIADNGGTEKFETRVDLDLEGNTIAVTDARQNAVMIYGGVQKDAAGQPVQDTQGKPMIVGRAFDLLGHNLYSYSMDAGDRWMLNNVAGQPLRAWNDRQTRYDVPTPPQGHVMRTIYDALQRPTHLYMQATGAAEILVERLVYGEGHPEALRRNLKGQPFQHYDGAGVVSNWEFDFKGNLLRGSRQLAKDYKQLVDWMVLADLTEIPQLVQAAIALLEPKTFDSSTSFDGLNRPIEMTMPDRSVVMPVFNEANLLNRVQVRLRGVEAATLFVKNIDYDEKGQRSLIEYGNDVTNQGVVKTEYRYDPETFRLMGLKTTRKADGALLQDLNYTYDPVGNITTIRDEAQQEIYFDGQVVPPSTQYKYDALYRLIEAAGREHIGQTTSQPPEMNPRWKPGYDSNDWTRRNLPHRNQGEAMRNYAEAYEYDAVGNILAMIHAAGDVGSWRRDYNYGLTNNRLLSTTVPGLPNVGQSLVTYDYDAHGNMTKMPHLPLMRWDFKDQLRATSQQVRSDGGTPEITYYVYDASGQRVRKVTEGQAAAGGVPQRRHERIYLGGFEVYREYSGSDSVKLERETLHVMDDQQRIALVETKTVTNPDDESPTQLIRFQFGNHLGSASLELDDGGRVISYEEYYPYGSTAYHAVDKGIKAAGKRYRYTGMERDDETGLNYHSARYYVPWLGRWVSCDPIGIEDGLDIYQYVRNNPVILTDSRGTDSNKNPPRVTRLSEEKGSFGTIDLSVISHEGPFTVETSESRNEYDNFGRDTGYDIVSNLTITGIAHRSQNGWGYEKLSYEKNVFRVWTDLEIPPPFEPQFRVNVPDKDNQGLNTNSRNVSVYHPVKPQTKGRISNILDWVQGGLDAASLGLDATGIGAVISWVPDLLNAGISVGRRDWVGAGLSMGAAIPFAGSAANVTRLGKTAGLTKSSSHALGRALEVAGNFRPSKSAAHHIVAGSAKAAAPARAALVKFGIGINEVVNGVFLPKNRLAARGGIAIAHSTTHTKAYYNAVNKLLGQATTRQEVVDSLKYISDKLLNGGFP
jgi:RHS repeat-associated protein